jgi:predicted DCC family thiol-disulfide oxidoreductase YuxK
VASCAERRPTLVFDGDCAFCTSCAGLLERIGPKAEIVAWQVADLGELGITAAQAAEAVRWVGAEGTVRTGHEALAAALGTAGPAWRIAGKAILLPGVSPLAAAGYRLVARNRYRLPGGTPACATGRVGSVETDGGTRLTGHAKALVRWRRRPRGVRR